MPLSHEHKGSKKLEEIKIYSFTRAELLYPLCYEIPCIFATLGNKLSLISQSFFLLSYSDLAWSHFVILTKEFIKLLNFSNSISY